MSETCPPPRIVKAPHPYFSLGRPRVFLAGSIEMGAAEDWQAKVTARCLELGYSVMNPRRDDWDALWSQEITNVRFREQVEWELSALEDAEIILLYLSPGTKSPISLLELGLFARTGKLLVVCPPGFWRKGNVDIVCARYGVPLYATLKAALMHIPRATRSANWPFMPVVEAE